MSQKRGIRRGTRTRTRYSVLDRLMLAGITGGGTYFVAVLFTVPVPVAVLGGVLAAGYYLGSVTGAVAVRSPIVWRRTR
ncbi:hypothetical protein [Actinomadura geliboluensis]